MSCRDLAPEMKSGPEGPLAMCFEQSARINGFRRRRSGSLGCGASLGGRRSGETLASPKLPRRFALGHGRFIVQDI